MYVLLDCKLSFRCFDGVAVLSANCRCGIKPARSTKNFGMDIVHSGNRRKFTSMFNCASLARPLCQRCQRTDEILSAPNSPYHASEVDEQCSDDVKHWKDWFYRIKQNIPLELRDFSADSNALSIEKFERLVIQFRNRPINLL